MGWTRLRRKYNARDKGSSPMLLRIATPGGPAVRFFWEPPPSAWRYCCVTVPELPPHSPVAQGTALLRARVRFPPSDAGSFHFPIAQLNGVLREKLARRWRE